jgi:multiple sugar transport system permease protein
MHAPQRNRGSLSYLVAILISLWVLVPIYFIASMALTTREAVREFPKSVLPFIPFSTDTMNFFLNSTGIIPGIINSVIVAVITLVLSTIIAAPAGYAISRYIFPGRDLFRLSILAVRAFPIVVLAIPLAVVFINLGIFDSVYSLALMHTALTLPTTILIIGSVFASIPYELEEAAHGLRLHPFSSLSPGGAAPGAAGHRGGGHLHLCHVLERGLCRQRADHSKPHPARPSAERPGPVVRTV